MRCPLALVLATAFFLTASLAHAEPTSWLAAGPGLSEQYDNLDKRNNGTFAIATAIGLGTEPTHPVVVGGVFRTLTSLGLGTDVSLSARAATAGFALGEWGVALDVGVAARWWRYQDYGHFPLQVIGVIGVPAGLQLEAGLQIWDVTGDSPTAKGGFVAVTLDLFRLASKTAHAQRSFFGSSPPPALQVIEHTIQQPPAPPP